MGLLGADTQYPYMPKEELRVDVLETTIQQLEAIQDAFEHHQGNRPPKNMVIDLAVDEFYDMTVKTDGEYWD